MSLIQPARGVLEKLRRQLWPSRNGPPRGKSKDFRAENDLQEGMVGFKKGTLWWTNIAMENHNF